MKPVDQTTFGFPGGNCFSACVASILELPLKEVPYFMDHGEDWLAAFGKWLQERGMTAICLNIQDMEEWVEKTLGIYILSGLSPRAPTPPDPKLHLHSVVARGNSIIHDPHYSRSGLLSHSDAVIIVPLDPVEIKHQLHQICRRFDPWACDTGPEGQTVDPNICMVCGGTEEEHKG